MDKYIYLCVDNYNLIFKGSNLQNKPFYLFDNPHHVFVLNIDLKPYLG